jgi:hypothetical protein
MEPFHSTVTGPFHPCVRFGQKIVMEPFHPCVQFWNGMRMEWNGIILNSIIYFLNWINYY